MDGQLEVYFAFAIGLVVGLVIGSVVGAFQERADMFVKCCSRCRYRTESRNRETTVETMTH